MILTEGHNGVVGVQYFRFIQRLHRDPHRKRSILRHLEGWASDESDENDDNHPQTMFAQTNPENPAEIDLRPADAPSDEGDGMHTAKSEETPDQTTYTPASGNTARNDPLGEITGPNPFSSAGSEWECAALRNEV